MLGFRSRRLNMPTGIGAIAFLIVAVLLAAVLSRVIGAALSLAFHLIGYVVAFGLAVMLLSWLWGRVTGGRTRSVQRWETRDARDEYGRRRY